MRWGGGEQTDHDAPMNRVPAVQRGSPRAFEPRAIVHPVGSRNASLLDVVVLHLEEEEAEEGDGGLYFLFFVFVFGDPLLLLLLLHLSFSLRESSVPPIFILSSVSLAPSLLLFLTPTLLLRTIGAESPNIPVACPSPAHFFFTPFAYSRFGL